MRGYVHDIHGTVWCDGSKSMKYISKLEHTQLYVCSVIVQTKAVALLPSTSPNGKKPCPTKMLEDASTSPIADSASPSSCGTDGPSPMANPPSLSSPRASSSSSSQWSSSEDEDDLSSCCLSPADANAGELEREVRWLHCHKSPHALQHDCDCAHVLSKIGCACLEAMS